MNLENRKSEMIKKINKLFKRIEKNKDNLIEKYVIEDLNLIDLEISRKIERMGY